MPPTVPLAAASSAIRRALRIVRRVELRQHLKRQREQRIAGQDRHRVAEDLVIGQLAAAVVVVIERGQIVVNQRIGVDQLQRAGRGHDARRSRRRPCAPPRCRESGRMRLPPANRL